MGNGDFTTALAWGQAGEEYVRTSFHRPNVEVEVKRPTRPNRYVYVEVAQNAHNRGTWTPSGIATTTTDLWTYVLGYAWIAFRTDDVKDLIRTGRYKRTEYAHGDNPTRGYWIPLLHLIEASWP